jgi:isopenicillin N synthase-like dioxygenase
METPGGYLMLIDTPPRAAKCIPIIDLAGSFSPDLADRKAVAWEIHKACRDIGFFYIENHQVPRDAMNDHLALAREFFALPEIVKREVDVKLSRCTRGYEGLAAQTLDENSPPDLKEGYITGCDLDETHPYVKRGIPGAGSNQWPRQPVYFKQTFNAYVEHMNRLGRHLMACLALSLELPEDYFVDGLDDPLYFSRILHYPPQSATASFNQLGAGAHTDWGTLTMLLQDDVGGLQVRNADGDWIAAPLVPGTFVVNLGEMVPILTNGLYLSTMHRVMNNASGRSRFSAPHFFDPNYFYHVKCVPTCLPEDGQVLSAETTVGEHIAFMNRKTYGLAA